MVKDSLSTEEATKIRFITNIVLLIPLSSTKHNSIKIAFITNIVLLIHIKRMGYHRETFRIYN